MIVKLSDSQVGLVFKFDSDSDEHMITKREAVADTQYGLLKMEVLNLSSSETFPLLINTRTDQYRMYSSEFIDNPAKYMVNSPHEIVETPEETCLTNFNHCLAFLTTKELCDFASYETPDLFEILDGIFDPKLKELSNVLWLLLYFENAALNTPTLGMKQQGAQKKEELTFSLPEEQLDIVNSFAVYQDQALKLIIQLNNNGTSETESEVPVANSGRLYANEQGLVFFKRGLYHEAVSSFNKAQNTTDEESLEDNMLFAIASYVGANDNMRFASKPTALKVFRHLDFLMGTRHKDIARVIWLCLYWQYGKSQINTVRLNSQFEELQQQQVKEISDIYCAIMSPIQRNVSSTTRSLFLNFKFV